MKINPPSEEKEEVTIKESTKEWIDYYWNVPHWLCACGATNFGRNKYCPACKLERKQE